MKQARILRSWI